MLLNARAVRSDLDAKIFKKSFPPSFLDEPFLNQLLVEVGKYGAKALTRYASGRRALHPQIQLFRGSVAERKDDSSSLAKSFPGQLLPVDILRKVTDE